MTKFTSENQIPKSRKKLSRYILNPHSILLLLITTALIFLYSYWPWIRWPSFFLTCTILEIRYKIIGFLFLIPFFYATIVFSWRGGLLVWFACIISSVFVVIRTFEISQYEVLSRNSLFWLLPPLLLVIISIEIYGWTKLVQRGTEQQTYMSQILKAHEVERKHISRELHDGTIQNLLIVANRAETLASYGYRDTSTEIQNQAKWLRDAVIESTNELRRLITHLRPSVLDSSGLIPALMWLIEGLNNSNGCKASLEVKGTERKLDPMMEVTVFRIVQEAIQNIKQHANAEKATVIIKFYDGLIELEIEDNGCGFLLPTEVANYAINQKFGLMGIRERIALFGGKFVIISKPGSGTKLTAILNYPSKDIKSSKSSTFRFALPITQDKPMKRGQSTN